MQATQTNVMTCHPRAFAGKKTTQNSGLVRCQMTAESCNTPAVAPKPRQLMKTVTTRFHVERTLYVDMEKRDYEQWVTNDALRNSHCLFTSVITPSRHSSYMHFGNVVGLLVAYEALLLSRKKHNREVHARNGNDDHVDPLTTPAVKTFLEDTVAFLHRPYGAIGFFAYQREFVTALRDRNLCLGSTSADNYADLLAARATEACEGPTEYALLDIRHYCGNSGLAIVSPSWEARSQFYVALAYVRFKSGGLAYTENELFEAMYREANSLRFARNLMHLYEYASAFEVELSPVEDRAYAAALAMTHNHDMHALNGNVDFGGFIMPGEQLPDRPASPMEIPASRQALPLRRHDVHDVPFGESRVAQEEEEAVILPSVDPDLRSVVQDGALASFRSEQSQNPDPPPSPVPLPPFRPRPVPAIVPPLPLPHPEGLPHEVLHSPRSVNEEDEEAAEIADAMAAVEADEPFVVDEIEIDVPAAAQEEEGIVDVVQREVARGLEAEQFRRATGSYLGPGVGFVPPGARLGPLPIAHQDRQHMTLICCKERWPEIERAPCQRLVALIPARWRYKFLHRWEITDTVPNLPHETHHSERTSALSRRLGNTTNVVRMRTKFEEIKRHHVRGVYPDLRVGTHTRNDLYVNDPGLVWAECTDHLRADTYYLRRRFWLYVALMLFLLSQVATVAVLTVMGITRVLLAASDMAYYALEFSTEHDNAIMGMYFLFKSAAWLFHLLTAVTLSVKYFVLTWPILFFLWYLCEKELDRCRERGVKCVSGPICLPLLSDACHSTLHYDSEQRRLWLIRAFNHNVPQELGELIPTVHSLCDDISAERQGNL